MNKKELVQKVKNIKTGRGAWQKGVKEYALMVLDNAASENFEKNTLENDLLAGAANWERYSYGACAYIYDGDIARTLANNSELKRTKNGALPPNKKESWLDVQARALFQAYLLIKRAMD